MFGPVIQFPIKRVKPYFQNLYGGSFTNGYASLINETIIGGSSDRASDQHPFTMAVGGGFDLAINKRVTLRLAEMDYILTRYTNPFTSTNNQNSFRYQGGVVVKFGGL
jgi:hypothetical protein